MNINILKNTVILLLLAAVVILAWFLIDSRNKNIQSQSGKDTASQQELGINDPEKNYLEFQDLSKKAQTLEEVKVTQNIVGKYPTTDGSEVTAFNVCVDSKMLAEKDLNTSCLNLIEKSDILKKVNPTFTFIKKPIENSIYSFPQFSDDNFLQLYSKGQWTYPDIAYYNQANKDLLHSPIKKLPKISKNQTSEVFVQSEGDACSWSKTYIINPFAYQPAYEFVADFPYWLKTTFSYSDCDDDGKEDYGRDDMIDENFIQNLHIYIGKVEGV